MSRDSSCRTVGFDRKIRLEWLDAAADHARRGVDAGVIRHKLMELLTDSVGGEKARENTASILMRIWVTVPEGLRPLRDEALEFLDGRPGRACLVLHWGMSMAVYPFFRKVASVTGKLAGVQGTVALAPITRRMTELWGDRSTVIRAVQRVVRSFVLWEVLKEGEEPGVFLANSRIEIAPGDPVGPWLAEAVLSNCGQETRPLQSVLTEQALFPFILQPTARDVEARPNLEVHRQGSGDELLVLTTK